MGHPVFIRFSCIGLSDLCVICFLIRFILNRFIMELFPLCDAYGLYEFFFILKKENWKVSFYFLFPYFKFHCLSETKLLFVLLFSYSLFSFEVSHGSKISWKINSVSLKDKIKALDEIKEKKMPRSKQFFLFPFFCYFLSFCNIILNLKIRNKLDIFINSVLKKL